MNCVFPLYLTAGVMKKRIVIVGAGVVGLSTAVQLQQRFGDKVAITIIADKFEEDTTSYGAVGIIKAIPQRLPGVPLHQIRYFPPSR